MINIYFLNQKKKTNYKTFALYLSNIKSEYSYYLMKGDSNFASNPKFLLYLN